MSAVDYSRFDSIVDSDEDEGGDNFTRPGCSARNNVPAYPRVCTTDPVQGEVYQPQSSAASDTPLVYAPPPEALCVCATRRTTQPCVVPQPAAQVTPAETGMTKVDPDKLDPEVAKKLGLNQVGGMPG